MLRPQSKAIFIISVLPNFRHPLSLVLLPIHTKTGPEAGARFLLVNSTAIAGVVTLKVERYAIRPARKFAGKKEFLLE
jgi:hypothetical protein